MILVIDDNRFLLAVINEHLKIAKKEGHIFEHAEHAIAFFRERWSEIDGVLLDFMMPQMNGIEVHGALKRINPDVRIVVMTGGGFSAIKRLNEAGITDCVTKPFNIKKVLESFWQ